jgi:glycosyltransferase involved in cell wall biosynthesis
MRAGGNRSIGVTVPCHDDAEYLDKALSSIIAALEGIDSRTILVADRCRDRSEQVARKYCEVIVKDRTSWKNSKSENNNLAFQALKGFNYFAVVDSDMAVPKDYFSRAIEVLVANPGASSVSSSLWTDPSTLYNSMYFAYETILDKVGLSRRNVIHGHRVYRADRLRSLFEKRGYVFRNVLSEDSALDTEIGPCLVMNDVVVWHLRRTNLSRSLESQIRAGMSRWERGYGLKSTIGEIPRLRSVIVLSYIASRRMGRKTRPS